MDSPWRHSGIRIRIECGSVPVTSGVSIGRRGVDHLLGIGLNNLLGIDWHGVRTIEKGGGRMDGATGGKRWERSICVVDDSVD